MRAARLTARGDRVVSPGLKTRPTRRVGWSEDAGMSRGGAPGCRAGLQTRRYARCSFHRAWRPRRIAGSEDPAYSDLAGSGGLKTPECREAVRPVVGRVF